MRVSLPIDSYVPGILELVRQHRGLVLTAAPGAGKTTRVPPALAADGPVIVLQPRRVAARSTARRIAEEQGWTPGKEVGWHIRFERHFTAGTRVLLATEGILIARLQQDPLLSGFRTIVLDEFHERTIHADLGIAFARQASREAAAACALLSERTAAPAARHVAATTDSDLLSAVERPVPPHVERAARALQALVGRGEASRATHDEFLRALLCGYPDRVGRRRGPGSARFLMTSGHGALAGPSSSLRSTSSEAVEATVQKPESGLRARSTATGWFRRRRGRNFGSTRRRDPSAPRRAITTASSFSVSARYSPMRTSRPGSSPTRTSHVTCPKGIGS